MNEQTRTGRPMTDAEAKQLQAAYRGTMAAALADLLQSVEVGTSTKRRKSAA